MTRSILAAVAASIAVAVVSGTGCNTTGIGDPCIPEQEYRTDFLSFVPQEVNTESKSFQCQTRLCLVNHFQGRVTCPYGQKKDGSLADGQTIACPAGMGNELNNPITNAPQGCCTPGVPQAVTGPLVNNMPTNTTDQQTVVAQCKERPADKAVYCSCRCANLNGATNDGANYCTCPDGFTCTQLVTSIGAGGNEGLTGAYCVKNGTQYQPNNAPCTPCNGVAKNCGAAPTQGITL
jgi:hypothetical protein